VAANPTLADVFTRHQVLLQRLSTREISQFQRFLRDIDRDLRAQLSGTELTEFTRARLEKQLRLVSGLLTEAFDAHRSDVIASIRDFAQHEAEFSARALTAAVDHETTLPADVTIRSAVFSSPLSVKGTDGGKLLQSFIEGWSSREVDAVTGAIRRGVFEGQTNAQIVKAIRGTKALNYSDGILDLMGRHAAAVVHTAIQHASTTARMATFAANSDIVRGVRWIATLDNRTCPRCGGLDQLVFDSKKGPRPPLHPFCRCAITAVLAKPFEALQQGATRVSVGADGPQQVPASEAYFDFLKRQPVSFQEMALGVARARLLRDGGLSASRFAQLQLDKKFAPMTLEQMKALEPLAFEKARVLQ
jgi:SPP1 gp7 family putative phage head morphogenesis protein